MTGEPEGPTRSGTLTVNAGSTSLKVSVIHDGRATAFDSLDDALADLATGRGPAVVAHRVVHGGERSGPVIIDDEVLRELDALSDLAPLHQPPALDAIRRCRVALPDATHVACFDTAFHTTIPDAARTYALPERLRRYVRVYGFHGLSHAWSAGRLQDLAPDARRAVVAHLGGGESLCALLDGRSVMTTMGFTPVDGLVMATRCGSIDPGAVLWLAAHTDEDLGQVFERESGLLGLAGTADLRKVLEHADQGDPDARLALDVYLHRLVTEIGACVAALGGLDALVFTGGIGEHADRVRNMVAEAFAWLGLVIDPGETGPGTGEGDYEISGDEAAVRTFVIRAREDLRMAAEVAELLRPR
jgi:acetate kinase